MTDEIKLLINEENLDVLSLTETDFVNIETAQSFPIEGFETFIQSTKGKVRTILLARSSLRPELVLTKTDLPAVTAILKPKENEPIVVVSVYRQWSENQTLAEEELESLQDIFDASKIKRFIAMGDWNIDAKKNSLFGKRLRDICQQNDAQIHTCGPTYFYGQGSMSSELDYFITRGVKGDFTVVRFANSDHNAIKAVLPVNQTSATDERKTIQIRSKIQNEKKFKEDMAQAMTQAAQIMPTLSSVDHQADVLVQYFLGVLNVHAPLRTVTIRPKQIRHVLSPETLEARKKRNKAGNAWMSALPKDKSSKLGVFKQLRNRVNSFIKRDRALKSEDDLKKGKYPFEVAQSLLRDTKKQDTIKLIEDQKIVEKEDEVAKLINEFFINKVQDLKKGINQGLKVDPLQKI